MHFLLVNDDGIHSPGIRALCDAAAKAGHQVSICAPDCERSAASHSITLGRPLRAKRVDFPHAEIAYAVDGTPSDCARLGLYLIQDVDAVISGINNGSNLSGACIYSGTVAAATEASMSGTPALATSLCEYGLTDPQAFASAAKLSVKVAQWMLDHPLPRGCVYNLNVPACAYEEIRGVRAAQLGATYMDSPNYEPIETQGEIVYKYAHGEDSAWANAPDSDVTLTEAGYASLSKLTWNLQMNAADPDVSDLEM